MNLSTHFTLEEMLRSDAATRLDIHEQFSPSQEVINNLEALSKNVLEPLRELVLAVNPQTKADGDIRISSGYRCLRLNHAIGGAANSQHTLGQAADTEVPGMTVEEWYQFIKKSGIPFDQLIQEFGRWVHVSYNPAGNNRGQCLRAVKQNGKTIYQPVTN